MRLYAAMLPPDLLATTFALLSLVKFSSSATPDQWASRSIYQIMTDRFALSDGSSPPCDLMRYCGGTWRGIINKLDYIQGMGFSAIQISPVVKNFANHTIHGDAFHGYWPINWYELNENFGTAQDLKDLSRALHNRDMLLMVDVVINDMAVAINGTMAPDRVIDYSQFYPFNDESYYHPWCNLTDWFDPAIFQPCWLGSEVVALPDLNTTSPVVQEMTNTWIQQLISNYSIDGLRIDAAKHVDDDFLKSFVKAAGVFTMGEVYNQDRELMCKYATMVDGLANFATYFPLISGLTNGDLTGLGVQVEDVRKNCGGNITHLVTFSENHDLPRFASIVGNLTAAKNAIAFTMLAEGIPSMYQLQEHHAPGNYSPFNRAPLWPTNYDTSVPLYSLTSHLNALRNHAIVSNPLYISTNVETLHLSPAMYITRKGSISSNTQVVAGYFNNGSISETIAGVGNGTRIFRFQGGWEGERDVVEVLSCSKLRTNQDGWLAFEVDEGPKAWFDAAMLEGSGLCGRSLRPKVVVDVPKNESGNGEEKKKSVGAKVTSSGGEWIMSVLGLVGATALLVL